MLEMPGLMAAMAEAARVLLQRQHSLEEVPMEGPEQQLRLLLQLEPQLEAVAVHSQPNPLLSQEQEDHQAAAVVAAAAFQRLHQETTRQGEMGELGQAAELPAAAAVAQVRMG